MDWSRTSSERQLPRVTSLIMLSDAGRGRENPIDVARPNRELGYSVAEKKSQFLCSSTMEANTLVKIQYPLGKLEFINQSPVSAFNQHDINSKKVITPCSSTQNKNLEFCTTSFKGALSQSSKYFSLIKFSGTLSKL